MIAALNHALAYPGITLNMLLTDPPIVDAVALVKQAIAEKKSS